MVTQQHHRRPETRPLMEADRVALCGPKGRPDPGRRALRGAHTRSWLTLGGRRVPMGRPRARSVVEREHPGAAGSLREGLEETMTVPRLGIDGALYLTLRSTNPIENLNGAVPHHTRNVKRWRDGQMVLRWVGAALLQAVGGFRRVRGMRDVPKLCAALDRLRNARTAGLERKVA